MLLRNFRRKVYAKYIKPNLGNPTKLAKIPRCYRTLLKDQDDWNNFVTYTLSENFNVKLFSLFVPLIILFLNNCG